MAESWHSRSLRDILRILFTRWLSGLLIFALVIGAAVAVTLISPRSYQTSVTVRVPFTDIEEQIIGLRTSDTWEVLLKTLRETLMSPEVLSRTLARFDDAKLSRDLSGAGLKAVADPLVNDAVDAAAAKLRKDDPERVAEFRRNVRMETPGGQEISKSQVFTVYVRADGSDGNVNAKKLADLLIEEFRYRYYQTVLTQLQHDRRKCQARLDVITPQYDKQNLAYETFTQRPDVRQNMTLLESMLKDSPADLGSARVDVQVQGAIAELEAQRSQKLALRQAVQKSIDSLARPDDQALMENRFIPREVRTENATVRTLSELLAQKVARKIELEQKYEPGYPELDDVTREIAAMLGQIRSALVEGNAQLQADIDQADAALANYRQRGQGGGLPADFGKLLAEFRNIRTGQKTYTDQWTKATADVANADATLASARVEPSIPAPELAPLPDRPDRPIVWLNLTIGAAVALLLALAYLFLADFYDHSVRSTDEVERYLGVPVLTSVRRMRHPIRR
ncbi:MAG: hypothetical protein BIFFINMI_03685 [Phycisphaerae bacterium]|nr:hypothetical protein [Phycisphaerae bacterium]